MIRQNSLFLLFVLFTITFLTYFLTFSKRLFWRSDEQINKGGNVENKEWEWLWELEEEEKAIITNGATSYPNSFYPNKRPAFFCPFFLLPFLRRRRKTLRLLLQSPPLHPRYITIHRSPFFLFLSSIFATCIFLFFTTHSSKTKDGKFAQSKPNKFIAQKQWYLNKMKNIFIIYKNDCVDLLFSVIFGSSPRLLSICASFIP